MGQTEELKLEARELALYLLTTPHGNSLGCFRLPMAYFCDDLDANAKAVIKSLDELKAVGFLERDEEDGWTWICDFLEHNPVPNSNVGKAIGKLVEQIPQSVGFYERLLDANGFQILKAFNAWNDVFAIHDGRRLKDQVQAVVTPCKPVFVMQMVQRVSCALGKAEASRFIRDEMTGWSLDWFLKAGNFAKVREGNYDDAGRPGAPVASRVDGWEAQP